MAQSPSLDLRGSTSLRPELRQSLRAGLRQGMAMLALPAADLHAELARQAAENPFLVVDRPVPAGPAGQWGTDPDAITRLAAAPSLADHLKTQIACMDLAPRIRALALYLASDLDERGLLPSSDAEIAAELGLTAGEVTQARAALQACDPAGVGAGSVAACLALQLVDRGVAPDLASRFVGHLAALAEGRITAVARALRIEPEAARALADELRHCAPNPADRFGAAEVRPLTPELEVVRTRLGGLVLRLLDDPAATLSLDTALMSQAARAGAAEGQVFARARQAAARRLVASVSFRSRTLLRVGEALLEAQSAYFMGLGRAPVPLQRAGLAAQLGLHPTTVGRAVKGRGLLFAGQVRPMGWFFPPGIQGRESLLSQPEIMARMRDLVAAETADTVLSDEALALRLREDGVDIARRTVAKYRQCLHIPSSSRRRRMLAQKADGGA